MKQLIIAIKATVVFTILTGMLYPALVTGLARAIFPRRSDGSLMVRDGRVIGSELIGQRFTRPEYFHGRPSAAGNDGYDAANSGGSNLGPTNQKLIDRVRDDVQKFRAANPDFKGSIPADLFTSSASGLDPHISPAAAEVQAAGVAKARGVSEREVLALVKAHVEGRQWRILGEPRVNVLELNLALDRAFPGRR